METKQSGIKVIVSGGGTGGHIFPAISIANAIRAWRPDAQILFVGALGKMEMEKVPAAGYDIVGLPVAGFQRRFTVKNFTFLFKLLASMLKARRIVNKMKPDVVVGVGGYASGPVLRVATSMGIPALIQEQNSYPGVTNKLLAKKVQAICVAYEGMDVFFPKDKIVLTGNPVRQNLLSKVSKGDAADFFGLDVNVPTVLVIGGSLGARSVNEGVLACIDKFVEAGVQVIWQTGKYYYGQMEQAVSLPIRKTVKIYDFVMRMDYAYALADVVVSRAGASSISEIALLGKPAILVPSPNVAEDHQTKNAMALVSKNAAVLVKDSETFRIADEAIALVMDQERLLTMTKNVSMLSKPNASDDIAKLVVDLASKNKKA
jgi:UDP-N-acetylglucosamine--N-acetylmuramyl-(pentapeptide) pyrophosphoryl-undecaprenol N-acetylglucosamine transferase